MTLQEFYNLLKTTGFPVAYYSFNASNIAPVPKPPYVVYLCEGSDNFGADNKVYHKTTGLLVELYTSKKDIVAEQKLETVLDSANVFYNKNENYIESEELFQNSYSVKI